MINEGFTVFSILLGLSIGAIVTWRIYSSHCRRLTDELILFKTAKEDLDVISHHDKIQIAALTEKIHHLSDIEQQKNLAIDNLQQARQQLSSVQAELAASRQSSRSSEQQAGELARKLAEAQNRIDGFHQSLSEKDAMLAKLNTVIAADRKAAQEKMDLLMQAREKLSEQFQKVADGVLEHRTKQLHEQQTLSLTGLLSPLKTKLDDFQKRVDVTHQESTKDRAMLATQVQMLTELNQLVSQETQNLTKALKGESKTQGIWGEIILERLLELSGLTQGREYDTQVSGTSDVDGKEKKVRPDVILNMPGARHLIIDAKVSLTAFERYMSAENEPDRQIALKQHVDSIRAHLDGLSKKNYPSIYGLNTVDYVIMFVAIEPAFLAAISNDVTLYQDAWQKHVLLVCPSTLLFVLRMIDALWRQENQKHNAEKILKMGKSLYDKFCGFYQDFESMGKSMSSMTKTYEAAQNKLMTGRGNLYGQIEALAEQKLVVPKRRLPDRQAEALLSDSDPDVELVSLEDKEESI